MSDESGTATPKKISRREKKQLFALSLFILVIVYLADTFTSATVIDEETGTPLEGVIVMASWKGSGMTFVHSSSNCYAFAASQTDNKGQFRLRQLSWNLNPLLLSRFRAEELYLAGYETSPNNNSENNVRKMRKFRGSSKDRLAEMARIAYRESCVSDAESKEYLAPLYKAQLEEATKIAITPEDKEQAEKLRMRLISAEVGGERFREMLMDGKIR